MRRCVLCGLSLQTAKHEQLSVGFHRFPVDPEQRKAWERFCYGTNGSTEIGSERVVCSFHFTDGCFRDGTKRYMLKDGVVPTIRKGRTKQNENRFTKPFAIENDIPLKPLVKLENVCRICESSRSLHDLTLEHNAEQARRFYSLTSIVIDATAPWCCAVCIGQLNDAYGFVQQCIEAEDRRKGLHVLEQVMLKQEEEEEEVVQEVWEESMEETKEESSGDEGEESEEDNSDDYSTDNEPETKEAKVYTCDACEATFDNWVEKCAHVKTHGRSRFPCKLCDKAFARKTHLNEHMFSHKAEPSFFCTQCPMGFKTRNSLRRHINGAHLKLKPFGCDECDKVFAQKTQLQSHYAVHMTEPDTPCQLCNKKFKTKARLRTHMSLEHAQKRLHNCDICQESFSSAQSLYRHKGNHHDPEFLCNVCGNKYRTNALLNCHLTTHNTERPFQCEKCPSEFKSSKALHYHQLVHSGLKPHPCLFCDRTFRTKTHLKTHTMSVHTKEKPHECLVCNRRFTLPGNLRLHMKVHQGRKADKDAQQLQEEGLMT